MGMIRGSAQKKGVAPGPLRVPYLGAFNSLVIDIQPEGEESGQMRCTGLAMMTFHKHMLSSTGVTVMPCIV